MIIERVKTDFSQKFGDHFRLFAAPGRLNIIGEHTDYNNGFVLPAAIDKKVYLAIRPTGDHMATIYAIDLNETVSFDVNKHQDQLPQWAKYPFGVIKEMQKARLEPQGFTAVFSGDIPAGAGLSSSAALESVFAVAINTIFGLGVDKLKMAHICQMAEHHYAGVKCGIMDQFASIFGKKDHAIRLDCQTLEFEYFPINTGDHSLFLADTRVKHSLASSEYNIRRMECEKGIQLISNHLPHARSLRDLSPEKIKPFKTELGSPVFERCEYVTEENDRVLKSCEAMEKGDFRKLGEMMFGSHEGLSLKYNVSCPELDLLVKTAKSLPGVLGSRMMGGGFGGCTINLVENSAMEDVKTALDHSYLKQFGKSPVFYNVCISDGAGEI
ncbi:MAG TPA: galactokinase [Saprospiraceae bacterium]|nr:galactokinase [Saprospirales bacterium]HRQ28440.1 galactokinase [Saprospiraceae bacterium]